jgi:hypothetical protein
MSTPCISCAKFTLKGAPSEMLAQGRGRCLALAVNVYPHIERNVKCREYRGLPENEVSGRKTWWAKKQQQE